MTKFDNLFISGHVERMSDNIHKLLDDHQNAEDLGQMYTLLSRLPEDSELRKRFEKNG